MVVIPTPSSAFELLITASAMVTAKSTASDVIQLLVAGVVSKPYFLPRDSCAIRCFRGLSLGHA